MHEVRPRAQQHTHHKCLGTNNAILWELVSKNCPATGAAACTSQVLGGQGTLVACEERLLGNSSQVRGDHTNAIGRIEHLFGNSSQVLGDQRAAIGRARQLRGNSWERKNRHGQSSARIANALEQNESGGAEKGPGAFEQVSAQLGQESAGN